MKLAAFAVVIMCAGIATVIAIPMMEPSTRDDCIMKSLHKMQTDRAVTVLTFICDRRFPNKFDRFLDGETNLLPSEE